MHNDTVSTTPPSLSQTTAQEADAALHATTAGAKKENTKQIAELADATVEAHIAEHIRGMVASTVDHVSIHATATTREHTEHWQQWALGVADGVERGESAVA